MQRLVNQVSWIQNARQWMFLAFIGLSLPVFPQFYNGSQVTFGKNRVQYSDFLWNYFRFNNVDVYYYLNGRELAIHAADYARDYLPEIEKKLETSLGNKVQIIVFNSLSDLKQTNLGLLNQVQYNTGGITHILGHKIFIYFDGNLDHFDQQIRAGLARILLEGIIYGETIGSQIKNNTLINLPSWYIDGLDSYYSKPWDTEMDNLVKDGILDGRYRKFNHLSGQEAVLAGHSIWRFIAQKYGEENISNIIYMTRVNRNVESGFLYVLGISFRNLMKEWQSYYVDYYRNIEKVTSNDFGEKPSIRIKAEKVYDQVKLSPDGEQLAYTVNDHGFIKVLVYDINRRKLRCIYRKGVRLDEKVDYSQPIITWHPSGQILAMILESKGLIFIKFYDMQTRKWQSQNLFNFQKVLDFSYSPDGRSFVFSAVQRGQSDIYLYNIAANSYQQITNDIYNDENPRFLYKSSKIIFTSNRPDDTLRQSREELSFRRPMISNDLFLYDAGSKPRILTRLIKTPLANETQPMSFSGNYFSYLSDDNGIINRYTAIFDSAISFIDTTVHYRYFARAFPVTNYSRNILAQDISVPARRSAEVIYNRKKYHLFVNPLPEPGRQHGVNLTRSQYMEEKQKQEAARVEEEKQKGPEPRQRPPRKKFTNVYVNEIVPEPQADSSKIDIGNYRITSLPNLRNTDDKLLAQGGAAAKQPLLPPKQRNYNVEYSINQLISQLDFSYLNLSYQPFIGYAGPVFQNPSTNALLTVGATDLMEDYRIIGGVRLNSNLYNNEYLLGFANLKNRLDREMYFHRTCYDVSYSDASVRHRVHELHYVMRYPFSEVLALKGSAMLQYDKAIVLVYDQYTARIPGANDMWTALKGELVYDNTRELGTNLLQGLRYKIFGEYYQLVDKKSTNMQVVGFDFRHYTRIHRNFIWANRFAGSTSFGKSKLLYYLGGVDNWLIPGFDNANQIDYTQNYAFQTLATNMRGFKQNIRNGNTFALYSSELRFPVIRYFLNRPLKSQFLNDFQVVGFADIGSAWKGLNPFSDENTYFTQYYYRPPLDITVRVQKDPLVAGYGFGLRSTLFGYFIRADWAWGIEDYTIQPRLFYLSLSLDF